MPTTNQPFIAKTMTQWITEASCDPIPRQIFGPFWYETEVCLLFSDTNAGKSTLAYQIADGITKHYDVMGMPNETAPAPVLYFDYELSKQQLLPRYSEKGENPYSWDEKFIRIERNPDDTIPRGKNHEDYLNEMFRREVEQHHAKFVVVDNITALRSQMEKAGEAIQLMSYLRELKNKLQISILILAHTPKRDMTKQITINDLAGSKQIVNLADNVFAIGISERDPNLRYLKQIKPKLTETIYGPERVITCQIQQPDNFRCFEMLSDNGQELYHLKQLTTSQEKQLESKVLELHREGKSLREIGKSIEKSYSTVDRIIKKARGQLV